MFPGDEISRTTYAHTVAFIALALIVLFIPNNNAQAQSCTFTNTGLDFGSVDLTPGTRIRTTGTFTATCTGIPGQRVRVCANFGSGTGGVTSPGDPRHMLSGANSLNYNIYKNGAYTNIWGSQLWPFPPTQRTINMRLNGSGTASRTRTIRGEIYAGQPSTPVGLYSSSFAGGHTLIAYAYRSVGNCAAISALGGVLSPFNVTANVLGTCTVSATDLNFGTVGVLSSNQDTTNTVSVTCTNLTPYTIGLDDGTNGIGDPEASRMRNGPNHVSYGIYQDASRTTPWGDTIGTDTISATATGSVQNYTGYGRVPPQTTPGAATYNDTIVVTVTY